MHLRFESLQAADAAAMRLRLQAVAERQRLPVALFGGGHVGHAIVRALTPLPVRVHWIDSRDEVFPADLPPWIGTEHSAPVQAAVAELAAQSRVLIMSFSHAEDLDIVAACLQRQRERADLPYVGLIGSRANGPPLRIDSKHAALALPSGRMSPARSAWPVSSARSPR